MGRTPAQIFGFTIVIAVSEESVRDLPDNAGGPKQVYRPFVHLLGGDGQAIEIERPIVVCRSVSAKGRGCPSKDWRKRQSFTGQLNTAFVRTRTIVYADFCYVLYGERGAT